METKNIPVTVYAEQTPNPTTMKFVASKMLIDGGASVEYSEPEQTTESPLASQLFNFPFVQGIFISGNFISVTKNDLVEWEDIAMDIREYILDYLKSGHKVFNGTPGNNSSENPVETATVEEVEPKTEMEKQIVTILNEYIKPAVEQDGGAILFKSYKEGICTVMLKGACSGCPSSMITLKSGIEGLLKRMLPEVKEVRAEEV